jgi:hypothetical protein
MTATRTVRRAKAVRHSLTMLNPGAAQFRATVTPRSSKVPITTLNAYLSLALRPADKPSYWAAVS